MKRKWLLIPEYAQLEASIDLAQQYDAGFEYNDFFNPVVYEDAQEVKKRIADYKRVQKDRSMNTLHGVFYDIAFAGSDSVIRKRSRELMHQSMQIAEELEIRGVVFHTGLLSELSMESYIGPWIDQAEEFFGEMLGKHPGITVYVENTFEKSPDVLLRLKQRFAKEDALQLCLDYGHAILTPTPIEEWVDKMSEFIGHMHMNDNDLKVDLHAVPGEGNIDWKKCSTLLERYHVETPVLLELRGIERQRRALEYTSFV